MLTNIENRLEELFEQIEMMPTDKVEAAEKVGTIFNLYNVYTIYLILRIILFFTLVTASHTHIEHVNYSYSNALNLAYFQVKGYICFADGQSTLYNCAFLAHY